MKHKQYHDQIEAEPKEAIYSFGSAEAPKFPR